MNQNFNSNPGDYKNSYVVPNYQQAYNPYQPNLQQPTQLNQFIVKNVNSFDEAKNSNIDFYNTHIFMDSSNPYIYMKKINNNGLEDFYTFRLCENPPDRMELLEQRMFNIEKMLERVINNVSASESNDVPTNAESIETAESSPISKRSGNATGKKP